MIAHTLNQKLRLADTYKRICLLVSASLVVPATSSGGGGAANKMEDLARVDIECVCLLTALMFSCPALLFSVDSAHEFESLCTLSPEG
jgi:hypothetical protein